MSLESPTAASLSKEDGKFTLATTEFRVQLLKIISWFGNNALAAGLFEILRQARSRGSRCRAEGISGRRSEIRLFLQEVGLLKDCELNCRTEPVMVGIA